MPPEESHYETENIENMDRQIGAIAVEVCQVCHEF